jgi:hypothetical protein
MNRWFCPHRHRSPPLIPNARLEDDWLLIADRNFCNWQDWGLLLVEFALLFGLAGLCAVCVARVPGSYEGFSSEDFRARGRCSLLGLPERPSHRSRSLRGRL